MISGIDKTWIKMLCSISMVCLLNACVTTESGSLSAKADEAKALEVSLQLARQYIRDRNWKAAKRHLKTALKLDDSSAEIYEGLALVFQSTGEIELAEHNYKKSIKLNPDISRVHNNYGAFLYQQRRFDEAAEQLEIAVADTLYERRTSAFINLGRCYMQLNKPEKAEKVFRRAYLMSRNNIQLTYALSDVYFQLGDYPQSQRFFNAYRALSKHQSPQGLWLGIRLAKKFDDSNALSSYALALKNLFPTSQEYLDYKREFANEH